MQVEQDCIGVEHRPEEECTGLEGQRDEEGTRLELVFWNKNGKDEYGVCRYLYPIYKLTIQKFNCHMLG